MSRSVLVVGGAGYIGSHTAKLLLKRGYTPVILDDLSTGHKKAAQLATNGGAFLEGSYADQALVEKILKEHKIQTVMHFGARSLVGESVLKPGLYYEANVSGTLKLLEAMLKAGTKNIIFSSTCATFGIVEKPIDENTPQAPINPYGRSKLFVEKILRDYESAYGVRAGILRYFNAAGADPEGQLGEDHNPETHLIPNALKALTTGAKMTVFGNDYPTSDGSCIRDYIHINDLADAHIRLMEHIDASGSGLDLNLGSGKGYSVFEILAAIKAVTGKEVPHTIGARRPGDPAQLVANSSKAAQVLKWKPEFDLNSIVKTAYDWMLKHPSGYGE